MPVLNSGSLNQLGLVLIQQLLTEDLVGTLRSQINSTYNQIEDANRSGRSIDEIIGPGERYVPIASSFTVGAAISQVTLALVLAQITTESVDEWLRHQLENELVCDLDQSWVRRQYAPAHYPRLHAPHGWHQDGALKFDFAAHQAIPFPADALLNMVTCWIALDPCGKGAPGLEVIAERIEGLLSPNELTNESVQKRYPPDKFWTPILNPGDAILFRGHYLHRTYVTPTMSKDRTSIELRFFAKDKVPQRIQSDRFLELSAS